MEPRDDPIWSVLESFVIFLQESKLDMTFEIQSTLWVLVDEIAPNDSDAEFVRAQIYAKNRRTGQHYPRSENQMSTCAKLSYTRKEYKIHCRGSEQGINAKVTP